jgi:mannose-6-phosphate isomerase-like protein (cupin superfamily)
MTQVAGVAYGGPAGTRHNVVSAGADPIVFVEVELKQT